LRAVRTPRGPLDTIGGTIALAAIAVACVSGCSKQPEALMASAKDYLAKNDRAAAIIQLRSALQKNSNLSEARFLLGNALFENGDNVAAEKELRRALELGYSYDAIAPLLARLLVLRGDNKRAVDEFAKGDVLRPEARAELQTALGQAYLGLRDIPAARERFNYVLTQQPGYPPALVGLARVTALEGNLTNALSMVETAVDKSPALVEAWQLKGDILTAQGQTEFANVTYRKALEVKPDYLPAHSALVLLFMQQGKFAAAGSQLESMQKVAPNHPLTLYLEALLAFQQKDLRAAREAIQKQLARAPDYVPGLVLTARIDNQLGAYAQAETALLKVLQRFPKHPAARMTLVDTYVRMGQVTKAVAAMRPLLEDADPPSDVLAFAGEVYARNGESAKAARSFERAAALDPNSVTKRTAVALSHLAMGEEERGLGELEAVAAADTGVRADLALITTLARQKKFDGALNATAALEKKQTNKSFTHTLRGEILVAKGDLRGAQASFQRALSIEPTNFPATVHLAQLDLAAGKHAEAKGRFDALLANDPKNVNALLALAALRVKTGGTTEEVASMIGKAVAAAPNDPEPRLAMIAHYLIAGEPTKAVAAAQDAVAAFPGRPEFMDTLARVQQAAGNTNGAIATYRRLAQLLPDSPIPFIRIADLQVLAKDNKGARESLQKALAVTPDLYEAQRKLVALELDSDAVPAAIAVARNVQKRQPKESAGYILEGDIYARNKAWSDAVASYRNGLRLVGTSDLAVRLTAVLRAGGNYAEADQFAAAWLKQHPDDRVFTGYRAEAAVERKDYLGAAGLYKELLQKYPTDVVALNNLASVAHQLKDPKAVEYAEKANELAPDTPAILDTLSELLLEKGETKRAVELQQRAVGLAPDDTAIRLNYARALLKDGQKAAATKQLLLLEKLGDKYVDQEAVAKVKQAL
jgi:putative PEP-CTERM system TPR-repeat lipoprotein